MLGYPDRAATSMRECLAYARSIDHPLSLAMAYNFAATFYQFRREHQVVQELEDVRLEYSTKHDFDLFLLLGMIYRGWLLAEEGHGEEGLAQMQQGLAAFQMIGAELGRPTFLGMLAELTGNLGRPDEGLAIVHDAFTLAEDTGLHYWDVELRVLKGQLLLQSEASSGRPRRVSDAESLPRGAEIARGQKAKAFELALGDGFEPPLARGRRGRMPCCRGLPMVRRRLRTPRPDRRERPLDERWQRRHGPRSGPDLAGTTDRSAGSSRTSRCSMTSAVQAVVAARHAAHVRRDAALQHSALVVHETPLGRHRRRHRTCNAPCSSLDPAASRSRQRHSNRSRWFRDRCRAVEPRTAGIGGPRRSANRARTRAPRPCRLPVGLNLIAIEQDTHHRSAFRRRDGGDGPRGGWAPWRQKTELRVDVREEQHWHSPGSGGQARNDPPAGHSLRDRRIARLGRCAVAARPAIVVVARRRGRRRGAAAELAGGAMNAPARAPRASTGWLVATHGGDVEARAIARRAGRDADSHKP
jgi:hypothetical protein